MNKKVIFWNINKKELNKLYKNTKYVISSNNDFNVIEQFDIKPIVMAYNGALIIDKDNNKIIKEELLNTNNIKSIINYFKNHDIAYKMDIKDNKIYQIQIESKNYYRMMILPMFIKNKFKNVKTAYNYPIKKGKDLYQNYIISDKITPISNLNLIIDYLDPKEIDIFELAKLIDNINNDLNEIGYFKEFKVRKEYLNENKTKG